MHDFGDVMLGSIELFCRCAQAQSFTAAARHAGLTPAAVSRSIARLEARLGVRLFARSTRQVRLTDAGRDYYEECRAALARLADAERELAGRQQRPAGRLRISVPTPLGHYRILPLLPRFRARYPDVAIEVHLSNRNVDIAAEGYDLAIRGRAPPDSALVARKLVDAELVVVATPAFLRRHGTPRTPADLAGRECIQFVRPSTGQRVPWLFRVDGADVDVATHGSLCCADDLLGAATLARAGAGLVQIMRFVVEDDLASGALREVLKPHGGRARTFSVVYPGARHVPLRVRAFVDFLVEAFGA
jgi:DNA-binding transcriptional LysR family regulator